MKDLSVAYGMLKRKKMNKGGVSCMAEGGEAKASFMDSKSLVKRVMAKKMADGGFVDESGSDDGLFVSNGNDDAMDEVEEMGEAPFVTGDPEGEEKPDRKSMIASILKKKR
jgi:hypothetical protein